MEKEYAAKTAGEARKRRGSRHRSVRRMGAAGAVAVILCLALLLWTRGCEAGAYTAPAQERRQISHLLKKEKLTFADYTLLTQQTGLYPKAVDSLRRQGREEELLLLQEQFFQEVRISCRPNTVISREERLVDDLGRPARGMRICCVEEGDILLTFNSHSFGWRNGHAAIVIDAGKRLALEAQVLGSPSVVTELDRWERYPSFAVLRLKGADRQERRAIAEYAEKMLKGVPYRLTAGVWDFLTGGRGQTPTGTQCAHLVWYAYRQFGYDLDSDGGILVTPSDIAESRELEPIQVYGMVWEHKYTF